VFRDRESKDCGGIGIWRLQDIGGFPEEPIKPKKCFSIEDTIAIGENERKLLIRFEDCDREVKNTNQLRNYFRWGSCERIKLESGENF